MAATPAAATALGQPGGARAGRGLRRRQDTIFALLATGIVMGLFLDGWAHINLDSTSESFFTPWHAVFYGAVAATECYLAALVVRNLRSGRRGLAAIPDGYGLSVVGAVLFPTAGLADFAWHAAFGVEVELAALLSPTHLMLLVAGALLFSGPLRSAWATGGAERRAGYREILPALGALAMAGAVAGFFLQYLSPFVNDDPFAVQGVTSGHGAPGDQVVVGIASVLVTTLLVLSPLLILLRRWRPPFGSATVIVVAAALFPSAAHGFEHGIVGLAAAPIGGLAADLLIRRLRPHPGHQGTQRLVAATVPLVLWPSYFLALALAGDLGWAPELWGGAILMSALVGLAYALLLTPATPAANGQQRTPAHLPVR